MVLEEANAIGSTGNFALMLPESAQAPILGLLREYTAVRISLGIAVAMVAMGFTGYNAGVTGSQRRVSTLIMSLMVAVLIMLVVDLDRPGRGLIQVPVQPLLDAAQGLGP